MIELGHSFLLLGFVASLWAMLGGAWAAFRQHDPGSRSAENALHVATISSWGVAIILTRLLLVRDYRIAYVWEYTSNTLPDVYAATALWGGQAGSLLFWLVILGTLASFAVIKHRNASLLPHAVWVLASIQFFFFILLSFAAEPLLLLTDKYPEAARFFPIDGNGLNPQLQNFGMIIHPPLLYLGYISISVPFAFAMAALASGKVDLQWIRTTRTWMIFSWMILGFGILCGARWAYVELGWGGYWAWDPVENASLMPWLTSTALLHSIMIEERRGMLRRWNIFLITITFLLSVFGTFLTRSGILSSVHSFTESNVGTFFIVFLCSWAVLALILASFRWKELESKNHIDSFLSRESAFLFQNLLLIGICGAVFWGTMYPILSEAVSGTKVNVQAPYFNKVILPLGLALYILTGAGPMISWRNAAPGSLKRNLGLPALLGAIISGVSIFFGGVGMATAAFGVAAFIFYAILLDLFTTTRARRKTHPDETPIRSGLTIIDRNHHRYGGFLTHIGMAIFLIGIAGNAFNKEAEQHLAPGGTMTLGHYQVVYRGYESGTDGHRQVYRATLSVFKDGELIATEKPEISLYFPGQEKESRNSEVSIRSTPLEDLYLIFAEPDGVNAVIRIMIHPLISFVWFGGFIAVMGALVAILPWRFALR